MSRLLCCRNGWKKVAAAQAAKRAQRETLTTDSRMRGRPKGEEEKPKSKPMGPPRVLSEEEKARRQKRQVLHLVLSRESYLLGVSEILALHYGTCNKLCELY